MSQLATPVGERTVESIEQLDAALRVVPLRHWAFLGVLGLTLVAFGVFACLYRAPLKVDGRGIILEARAGGVDPLLQVTAPATGRLDEVRVRIGQAVAKGQVLGTIAQSELRDEVAEAEEELKRLRDEDSRLSTFDAQEEEARAHALDTLEQTLRQNLRLDRERLVASRRIAAADHRLLLQGMLNNSDALKSQADADAVESAVGATEARLIELAYQRLEDSTAHSRERLKRALAISAAGTRLRLLRERYARDSQIRSGYAGGVVDLMITPHALVEKGAPVALLQPESKAKDPPLEAIVFVPAGQGKKVLAGHDVEVCPDTVRRQEHGFALGEVVSISEIPATELAMLAELKHKTLVASFVDQYAGQVLLSIRVRLRPAPPGGDPRRRNGLRWSSRSGAEQRLSSGTLCSASIVVERRPLVALAVPWVREMMGIY